MGSTAQKANLHTPPPDSIHRRPQSVAVHGGPGGVWRGRREAAAPRNRIDWPAVRARLDLSAVATALLGPPVARVGSRPAWRCPFHDDRHPSFTVDARGWRCWACGIGGDAASLVRRLNPGWSFGDAVAYLAGNPRPTVADVARPPARVEPRPPAQVESCPPAWARGLAPAAARALVARAARNLWTPGGADALAHLKCRGLRAETIRAARLGWMPRVILPTADGFRVWRARGIVIPWFDGRRLARVKIRQPDGRGPKYAQAFSDGPGLYPGGVAAIRPGTTPIVCEGELDALLLAQELGDLASVFTTGSASTRPDGSTWLAMLQCPRWFAAHDADAAGDQAAARWGGRPVRVRPPRGKDWTESHRAGIDLRRWWIEEHFPAEFDRHERAAIMEFDGGLTREESERAAGLQPARGGD